MVMKAITLHQPWSSLVALGAKKIETRDWSTTYRGRIAIHSSKSMPAGALQIAAADPFRSVLHAARHLQVGHLPQGYVLATAELWDVRPIIGTQVALIPGTVILWHRVMSGTSPMVATPGCCAPSDCCPGPSQREVASDCGTGTSRSGGRHEAKREARAPDVQASLPSRPAKVHHTQQSAETRATCRPYRSTWDRRAETAMSRNYDGWLKVGANAYRHERYGEVVRERTRVWRARPKRGGSSGGWYSMRQAQLVCERESR